MIRQFGHKGGGFGIDGPDVSWTTRQFGSGDPVEPIIAFYRQELASTGWATGGGSSIIGAGIERLICAWHKDGIVVRISFWKQDSWAKQHPRDVQYPTVFEVSLIEANPRRNETACAS